MKNVHEWKEPWKRSEPGARTVERNKKLAKRGEISDSERTANERASMEKNASQFVKVYFDKYLTGMPQQIRSFRIELKNPLHYKEIMRRIGDAFPEVPLLDKEEE